MRKHADYIYRNANDSMRVRVHRRENGRWDYDVFYANGVVKTYSDEAGDNFLTKRHALAEARHQLGVLKPIAIKGSVTDTEWYAKHRERRVARRERGGGHPGPFGAPGWSPRR